MKIWHVITNQWGPFVDIRACYASLAERKPDLVGIITPEQFPIAMREAGEDELFIVWGAPWIDPGPVTRRDCYVAGVWSEALDIDGSKMLPEHHAVYRKFLGVVENYDAIFAHTPTMRDLIAESADDVPAFVMPVGWDAAAMGAPRRDAPKFTQIAYRGSRIGRRETLIPILKAQFGANELVDMTGRFGRQLLGHLDCSAIDLYIAHSPVESFSTWRLWQAASTATTLVAEPGDTWPFVAGEHYIEISRIEPETTRPAAIALLALLRREDELRRISRAAHTLAREYNVDRITQDFVRPAFAEFRDKR